MGRKGKIQAKKSSHRTPQPPKPQRRESSPFDGDNSYGEDLTIDVQYGIMRLEARITELKTAQDLGGSGEEIDLLPWYEAELKALKARIREDQKKNDNTSSNGNDKVRAGDSSVVEEFDRTICSAEENRYYDDLRGHVNTWKVLACEGRKEGSKSLMEVLRHRSDGDHGLRARVFKMLIDTGIKISSLMAEYFALFVGTLEGSEIEARSRTMTNTLLIESLDEVDGSPVIDRFIEVIDSAIGKIRVLDDKDVKGKGVEVDDCEDQVLFGRRESELLGSIFCKVLYLEVVFCCPSFPEKLENKDLIRTRDYLVKLFDEKLGELSSELNEFKKRCETSDVELSSKRNELKEALDSEIKEIWKGLDLHQ